MTAIGERYLSASILVCLARSHESAIENLSGCGARPARHYLTRLV